jgi:hypothetical protein
MSSGPKAVVLLILVVFFGSTMGCMQAQRMVTEARMLWTEGGTTYMVSVSDSGAPEGYLRHLLERAQLQMRADSKDLEALRKENTDLKRRLQECEDRSKPNAAVAGPDPKTVRSLADEIVRLSIENQELRSRLEKRDLAAPATKPG